MWLPKVVRSPGCHHEFRNGPAVKIDILDEGYWTPEVFRGYQAMASMTEKCFGSPDKCWRASWAKGEGANQPTKGWCAPTPFPTLLGTWGASTRLGRQASTCLAWGASLPRIFPREIQSAWPPPLGETLGRLPSPLAPIYSGGVGGQPHLFPGAALPPHTPPPPPPP